MALIRWQPFREVESLQREMNQLFDRLAMPENGGSTSSGFNFMPAAELHENSDQVTLRMELPGMEAKDLEVNVTAEAVAISGERKSEIKSEEQGMSRSEFRYGKFQRIIPLPSRIQNDKVQAEFKNGVLCLTLPKAEADKNKVVKLNLMSGESNQGEQQTQQTLNSASRVEEPISSS
jgi:HSP20 family protein